MRCSVRGWAVVAAAVAVCAPGLAVAGCGASNPRADLERALTLVEEAFAGVDADRFRTAMDDAAAWLACQSAPIDGPLAARYHRARAMWAYAQAAPELTEDERLEVQRITAAACAADPAGRFPDGVVEPDDDLAKWLSNDLACSQVGAPALPAPASGAVWLDGRPASTWLAMGGAVGPLEWPVIVQRVDAEGAVVSTEWLPAGARVPVLPSEPTVGGRPTRGPYVMLGLGAVAAVAGGVVVAVADPVTASIAERGYAGAEDLRNATRNQYYAAGGVAVGLGVALLVGGGVWLSASSDGAQAGVVVRLP